MFSCSTAFLVVIVCSSLNADLGERVHKIRGSTFSNIQKFKLRQPQRWTGIQSDSISNRRRPGSNWNDRRENRLKIRSFPVGQGDAMVIECPDGLLTVVDLGTSNKGNQGFYHATKLREDYFTGKYEMIRNIVITHNHEDHYNLFPHVLKREDRLTGLERIYITKTVAELPDVLKYWIHEIGGNDRIRVFNHGEQCGFRNGTCGVLNLCPNNREIVAEVLSVNAGRNCRQQDASRGRNVGRKSRRPSVVSVNSGGRSGNPVRTRYVDYENTNSIVFSIKYNRVKVHMNGDFEDCSPREPGAQLQMVRRYERELEATVYKLAHHGASNLANKKEMRDAVKPKAIFVSGNPFSQYRHPRCEIIDAFNGTLCEPGNPHPRSPKYCGLNPFAGRSDSLQEIYTCGSVGRPKTVAGNRLAIYTTVPNSTHLNEIEFETDGTHWGFINHYYSR